LNKKGENTEVKEYLTKHGIKPTLIRVKTLEYLWNTKEHPDAETIYNELSKFIPTLSITSVYNTLNLFVKKGIILEIKIEGFQSRYDGCLDRHAHFKCIKCGKLFDLDLNCRLDVSLINVGKIIEEHIYIIGICKDCYK
jgi:Fe2+ or Zn2+ uptake regulation protein